MVIWRGDFPVEETNAKPFCTQPSVCAHSVIWSAITAKFAQSVCRDVVPELKTATCSSRATSLLSVFGWIAFLAGVAVRVHPSRAKRHVVDGDVAARHGRLHPAHGRVHLHHLLLRKPLVLLLRGNLWHAGLAHFYVGSREVTYWSYHKRCTDTGVMFCYTEQRVGLPQRNRRHFVAGKGFIRSRKM